MLYIIIFVAKIIEVSLATLRIVLITKGERIKGCAAGIFEISIWVILAGSVLNDITSDPLKAVVYCIGFVVGNYIGSWLEEKLAVGTMTIDIIVSENNICPLVSVLKKNNIGYTILDAQGQQDKNKFIVAYLPRKRKDFILKELHSTNIKTFIAINDSAAVYGGYGIKK